MNLRGKKENVKPKCKKEKNMGVIKNRNDKKQLKIDILLKENVANVKNLLVNNGKSMDNYGCNSIKQTTAIVEETIYDSVKKRNALRVKDINSEDELNVQQTKAKNPVVKVVHTNLSPEINKPSANALVEKPLDLFVTKEKNVKKAIKNVPTKKSKSVTAFDNQLSDSDESIYDIVKKRTAERKRQLSSESESDVSPKTDFKRPYSVAFIKDNKKERHDVNSKIGKIIVADKVKVPVLKEHNKGSEGQRCVPIVNKATSIATTRRLISKSKRSRKKVNNDLALSEESEPENSTYSAPKRKLCNASKQRKKIAPRSYKQKESKLPNDVFGFNSSGEFDSDTEPFNGTLCEFDPSKPFRLALYVKPSNRPRIDQTLLPKLQSLHPTLNITNASINTSTICKKPFDSFVQRNRSEWKMPMCSTPIVKKIKKNNLVQQKITSLPTFKVPNEPTFSQFLDLGSDNECELQNKSPSPKKSPVKNSPGELAMEKSECVEPLRVHKQNRRSYIKRPKPLTEDIEDEPSSDEIQKSIEKDKKKRKVRGKKPTEEDTEFEKWSASINSEFNEVDKFDLSICPDN